MRRMRRTVVGVALSLVLLATGCDPLATPRGRGAAALRDDVFSTVTVTRDITYGSAVDQEGQNVTLGSTPACGRRVQPAGDRLGARRQLLLRQQDLAIVDPANAFGDRRSSSACRSTTGCRRTAPARRRHRCASPHPPRLEGQSTVRFLRPTPRDSAYATPVTHGHDGSSAGASPRSPSATAAPTGTKSARPCTRPGAGRAVHLGAPVGEAPSSPVTHRPCCSTTRGDPLVPYAVGAEHGRQRQGSRPARHPADVGGLGPRALPQHRTQILTETRNFLYSQMDLASRGPR